MKGQTFVLLMCFFLLLDWNAVLAASTCCCKEGIFYCGLPELMSTNCSKEKKYTFGISPSRCATTIGVVVGIPAIIAALGFSAGGIGAGIFAAYLMSWWGGSAPAGGIVAILQSLGAEGLASFAMTTVGQALLEAGCLIREEIDEYSSEP